MLYKYEPNCHVIDYEKMRDKFCFDENGIFETQDHELIKWIKKYKNFLIGEENNAAREEIKLKKCKKCKFETDNNGLLMAHYRSEHPKGG